MAQGAVEVDRVRAKGDGHALRQHHLHDVPGAGVFAYPLHRRLEGRCAELRDEVALRHGLTGAACGDRRRRLAELRGQGAQLGQRPLAGARLVRVDQADELHAGLQVVEDDDVLGDHQQDVRSAYGVRRGAVLESPLHIAHTVIAEVAHQAAVKPRQPRRRRHPVAGLERLHKGQRVLDLRLFHQPPVRGHFNALAESLEHRAAGQADDGVAPPGLAPLGGFKQIRPGLAGQLQIGGKRGVQIGEDPQRHRHPVVAVGGQSIGGHGKGLSLVGVCPDAAPGAKALRIQLRQRNLVPNPVCIAKDPCPCLSNGAVG